MNIKKRLIKGFYNWWWTRHPPAMVKYWQWNKHNDSAMARVLRNEDGSYSMEIQGETMVYPGFPRGHLLVSSLSRLKHICKNRIFNDSWQMLENGGDPKSVAQYVKGPALEEVLKLTDRSVYDMVPYDRMVPPVKEIWDAWSRVEYREKDALKKFRLKRLKQCLCYILQEDDAYRFRVQWLVKYFNPNSNWKKFVHFLTKTTLIDDFKVALTCLEYAEVVDDMKGRIKLLRRILLTLLEDKTVKDLFLELSKEINWNQLKLSEADKYYFRGKYFKVDHDKYDY